MIFGASVVAFCFNAVVSFNGLYEFAAASGQPRWLAALVPFAVDTFIVIGGASAVVHRNDGWSLSRVKAWAVLLGFDVMSAYGQVAGAVQRHQPITWIVFAGIFPVGVAVAANTLESALSSLERSLARADAYREATDAAAAADRQRHEEERQAAAAERRRATRQRSKAATVTGASPSPSAGTVTVTAQGRPSPSPSADRHRQPGASPSAGTVTVTAQGRPSPSPSAGTVTVTAQGRPSPSPSAGTVTVTGEGRPSPSPPSAVSGDADADAMLEAITAAVSAGAQSWADVARRAGCSRAWASTVGRAVPGLQRQLDANKMGGEARAAS